MASQIVWLSYNSIVRSVTLQVTEDVIILLPFIFKFYLD